MSKKSFSICGILFWTLLFTACSSSEEKDHSDAGSAADPTPDYSGLPAAFGQRVLDEQQALESNPEDSAIVFNLARLHHANRFFPEAQAYYARLKDSPDKSVTAKVYYYLADIARYTGNVSETISCLESVVKITPNYLPAQLALGDNLYKQGESQRAIQAYEAVLALEPNNPFASLALARDHMDQGRRSGAIQLLEDTVSAHPNFSEGLVLLAKLLDETGDAQRAAVMRQQNENGWDLPQQDPWLDELLAFSFDGQSLGFRFEDYKRVGEIDRGLTYLQRMEEIDPSDPTPHLLRGNVFYEYERRDEAERELLLAIEKGAPPEHAYSLLVKTQIELGKLDLAEISAKEGLSLNPHIPLLLVSLGGIEIQKQNFEKAKDYLLEALLQDPTDTFVNRILSELYRKEGNLSKSAEHLESLAQVVPNDLQARIDLAKRYFELDAQGKAIPRLIEATRLAPENGDVRSMLTQAYETEGDRFLGQSEYENAIKFFSKAIGISPNSLNAYRGKLQAHVRLGQLTEAENTLLQVISMHPNVALFYSNLGDIQKAAGKPEEARESWRKAKSRLTTQDPIPLRQKLDFLLKE